MDRGLNEGEGKGEHMLTDSGRRREMTVENCSYSNGLKSLTQVILFEKRDQRGSAKPY